MARMKKIRSRKRGALSKARRVSSSSSRNAPQNFAEYLATAPQGARSALQQMRAVIRSAVPPAATETISYGIPAFRHNGVLVWFAAFSDHCSLFPTASIIECFKKELKGFSTSKGTIHFPLDKPLPVALIKKTVKARVKQHQAKKTR